MRTTCETEPVKLRNCVCKEKSLLHWTKSEKIFSRKKLNRSFSIVSWKDKELKVVENCRKSAASQAVIERLSRKAQKIDSLSN